MPSLLEDAEAVTAVIVAAALVVGAGAVATCFGLGIFLAAVMVTAAATAEGEDLGFSDDEVELETDKPCLTFLNFGG